MSLLMTKRRWIGVFLAFMIVVSLAACGGAGTEVVNPTNPNEVIQKTDENECYKIVVDLLPTWEVEFYGPDITPSPFTFSDPMPNEPTVVAALLTRGEKPDPLHWAKGTPLELTRFTFFYSVLHELSFEAFVESKVPAAFVEYVEVEGGQGALFTASTPEDHLFLVVFSNIPAPDQSYSQVLWYMAEIIGEGTTREEKLEYAAIQIHNGEFKQIFDSLVFDPKPCPALGD